MYDIGIVGGGTAGLTAAVYGQRAGKQTAVFESQSYGGQIVASNKVENYPGILSITGSEFAENLKDQAESLGAKTFRTAVKEIRDLGAYKEIVTERETYSCKTVILATGVTHRLLGLPNEKKLTGAGVSYCATCDGMFFSGREVAVIGGGSTALQDAVFLANYCKKVYVIHRREEFRGEQSLLHTLETLENVELIRNTIATELLGTEFVEGLKLQNTRTQEMTELPVDGVFVAIGYLPKNQQFAELVELDASGFIKAGEDCKTSRDGVFAAGDCRTKEIRQLTTAAADGAVAALAACNELAEPDREAVSEESVLAAADTAENETEEGTNA